MQVRDDGGGGGPYAYLGDHPSAVSAMAHTLHAGSANLGRVASDADAQVPRLRAAWTDGSAGDRAYAVASRLSDFGEVLPRGLRSGADALDDYHEELTRGRTLVDDLNAAYGAIAHLERRAKSFGIWIDARDVAAYEEAMSDWRVAAARVGYGSVADIDAAYAALKRRLLGARDSCAAVLTGLTRDVLGGSPTRLGGLAGSMPVGLQTAALVDSFISRGLLPPEAATMTVDELTAYLKDHPEVARRLVDNNPGIGPPGSAESFLHQLLGPHMSAPGTGMSAVLRQQARDYFETLTPSEQALVGILFPSEVGNLSGAPFVARDAANYVSIVVAREDQQAKVDNLQARLQSVSPLAGRGAANLRAQLAAELAEAQGLLTTYDRLVAEPQRQIVVFDAARGAFAEVTGVISPSTRNVGLICPGTTTNMSGILGNVDRYSTFVNAAPSGELAMVTWMGGGLPQSIFPEALSDSYSRDLGPRLAEFSKDLRQEANYGTAFGSPRLTVAGHSYGGAVVGISETYGLDADRVMHVESAGMGNDVRGIEDYRPLNPDVRRYSMTAPGDPIAAVQGADMWSLGHGADPDEMRGVTRLATGRDVDGSIMEGPSSHGGVFNERSDSWKNMYEVFTGGSVAVRPPDETVVLPRGGVVTVPSSAPPQIVDIP